MSKKAIVKASEDSNKLLEIRKLSQNITNTSNFIKSLDDNDKKLYKNMVELLKVDTKNELTETEYESISKMQFFCDRFETYFNTQNIQDIDPEVLDLYRKMKTQITAFLRDYREGTKSTPPSITLIKNYLIKTKDELASLKFVDKNEAEIIDIEIEDKEE